MGFLSSVFGGGNNSEDKINTKQVRETQKEHVRLQVDNAMDLITYLGKDIKNLSIPEDAIKYIGAHPFAVYYDAAFLGQPCNNVMLGFTNDYATKTDNVSTIYITCKKSGFWECKSYLDSQFGECHDCGTMPYVAVNGGALTYLTYYKDGVKYYLSTGSANDFYRLELSLEEPKNPPNRQNLGIIN